MDQWLDLHMHADASNDGEFTPEQLMAKCGDAGLKVVALTDHNSVRGLKNAKLAAKPLGLTVISGIELDCQINGRNLHLLGYGIDEERKIFADIEADVEGKERATSRRSIELVRALGISFDDAAVMALAFHGIVTGEMIAEAALSDARNADHPKLAPYRPGGSRGDNPYVNFYWDYCAQGKPAHVPVAFMDLPRAVDVVKEAGGIAVLAHPGVNVGTDRALLDDISRCGIDGIEVYSSYHDASAVRYYSEFAREKGLLVTIGSDFHGKTKPSIHLGKIGADDEAEMLRRMQERLASLRSA